MTYVAYEDWSPSPKSMAMLVAAREIITEYRRQGYLLTLRQLYYQFVARDLVPNTQRSYKNLGNVIAKGRMAGLIDWTAIEDRTRNLTAWQTFDSPEEAIARLERSFTLEKWEHQPTYVEVWVEKEALAGVFERICSNLEVPFFACRGYVSLSEMWSAAMRLRDRSEAGKEITVLHFGDHDPSGIDMTRDIEERTGLFTGWDRSIAVRRIALNMDQVEEHRPPPNPAKLTDSRASGYVEEYGYSSWELDALDPAVLSGLVRDNVDELRDDGLWEEAEAEEAEAKETLELIRDRYADVADFVRN